MHLANTGRTAKLQEARVLSGLSHAYQSVSELKGRVGAAAAWRVTSVTQRRRLPNQVFMVLGKLCEPHLLQRFCPCALPFGMRL